MATAGTRPFTVRSASAVVTFWVGIVALAIVVAVPLSRLDWRVFLFSLFPCLLLAWVLWFALFRPAVHYDDTRAVVINMGRRHVLPWGHVTNVRQGIGMLFDLDDGRSVMAYGATARRGPGVIAGVVDRRTRPAFDPNRDADLLDGVRQSAVPSDEPVTTSWEPVPLAIGAVLVVALVVEILLGV